MKTTFTELSRLDVQLEILSTARAVWGHEKHTTFEKVGRKCDLLYLTITGTRIYRGGFVPFELEAGEAIYIPTGATYTSQVTSKSGSIGIYIDFRLTVGGEQLIVDEPFRVFRGERLETYFDSVAENRSDRMRMRGEIYRLLSELSNLAANSDLKPGESLIREAMLEIERHPENPISVAELAKSCCMSQTGLRESFKRFTGGLTPTEYRNRIRCERASELLAAGSFSKVQIAQMLGFWDAPHMHRMMKDYESSKKIEQI